MARGGGLDRVKAVLGEGDDGATTVGGVVLARDESALLHAGDVVRQPALGPAHVSGEVAEALAMPGGLRQVGQHVVVGLGQPCLAGQVAVDLEIEQRAEPPVAAPGTIFLPVEPARLGHAPPPKVDVSPITA
jgi:hypothetical protein